jgi:hypothetical protein
MAKLLTRLKISEVSAVDRGAGEDCRILLRKRDQDVVAKATAALETSVGLILDSDDDSGTKRNALAETFAQFESYLDRNVAGSKALSKGPLEKAERARREKFEKIFAAKAADDDGELLTKSDRDRHVGHHNLAAAVVEHALDRLDHLRQKHGFEKAHSTKETTTMDREQELTSILKRDGGLAALCKSILDDGAHRVIDGGAITETEFVEAVSKYASECFPGEAQDIAFSKLFAASTAEATLLRKAHKAVRNSAFAGAGYPMPG